MHFLVGHHGLFSLSPIYLLSVVGMITGLLRWWRNPHGNRLGPVAMVTLAVTVVVSSFFILVVQDRQRNYGGSTCGPRWLLWLTPLLLLSLIAVADWLASRRWGRVLSYGLLAVSVLSASYPTLNPWRHPWLYNFFAELHLVNY
jgi:hypothetical protein